MQNLGQLSDWALLDAGEQIVIPPKASGKVTIKVNAPRKTALFYHPLRADGTYDKEAAPGFLALVEGLDEVQFRTSSAVAVLADAELSVLTSADLTVMPEEAGESFASIVERRKVSADVAAVMSRANANQRAMMRQFAAVIENQRALAAESQLALKQMKDANAVNIAKGAGGDAGAAGEQKPASDGGASAVKAAAGGEGDG